MPVKRSESEIDNQLNQASDVVDAGLTNWPGMSYEAGVHNALLWVTGQSDDEPMAE